MHPMPLTPMSVDSKDNLVHSARSASRYMLVSINNAVIFECVVVSSLGSFGLRILG
jgi:hypothetical protein